MLRPPRGHASKVRRVETAGGLPFGSFPEVPPQAGQDFAAELRRIEWQDRVISISKLWLAQEELATPELLVQTDETCAPPDPSWNDVDRSILFPDIHTVPQLPYQPYPRLTRQLPGGDSDPTRLIDHANCSAADVYATEERSWVPDDPDAHTSKLVNYEALAPWLEAHLPHGGH